MREVLVDLVVSVGAAVALIAGAYTLLEGDVYVPPRPVPTIPFNIERCTCTCTQNTGGEL